MPSQTIEGQALLDLKNEATQWIQRCPFIKEEAIPEIRHKINSITKWYNPPSNAAIFKKVRTEHVWRLIDQARGVKLHTERQGVGSLTIAEIIESQHQRELRDLGVAILTVVAMSPMTEKGGKKLDVPYGIPQTLMKVARHGAHEEEDYNWIDAAMQELLATMHSQQRGEVAWFKSVVRRAEDPSWRQLGSSKPEERGEGSSVPQRRRRSFSDNSDIVELGPQHKKTLLEAAPVPKRKDTVQPRTVQPRTIQPCPQASSGLNELRMDLDELKKSHAKLAKSFTDHNNLREEFNGQKEQTVQALTEIAKLRDEISALKEQSAKTRLDIDELAQQREQDCGANRDGFKYVQEQHKDFKKKQRGVSEQHQSALEQQQSAIDQFQSAIEQLQSALERQEKCVPKKTEA